LGDDTPAWPLTSNYASDLFAGTARDYARCRPAYPAELFDALLGDAALDRRAGLLDLACGTGQVALALSGQFEVVLAVDQEPEMIEVGRAEAARLGRSNVVWQVGPAEDVDVEPGSVDLVTIGNAFHRLDRPRVAASARRWLSASGAIAVVGTSSLLADDEPWQVVATDAARRWGRLGDPATGASPTSDGPRRTHEEVLAEAGFSVHEVVVSSVHPWTIDDIIGYLHSTSFASVPALGDHADRFEAELRARLPQVEPAGGFVETIKFFYVLGRREG
jgi:SAM-dependent methyltransferase